MIKVKSFKESLNKIRTKEARHKSLLSRKNPKNILKKK